MKRRLLPHFQLVELPRLSSFAAASDGNDYGTISFLQSRCCNYSRKQFNHRIALSRRSSVLIMVLLVLKHTDPTPYISKSHRMRQPMHALLISQSSHRCTDSPHFILSPIVPDHFSRGSHPLATCLYYMSCPMHDDWLLHYDHLQFSRDHARL